MTIINYYILNILIVYTIILCHSLSNNKLPSKLLSINNKNVIDDYTHYFESYHYKFDINEYDDINTINIDENNIFTITTHANDTIYKIDLNQALNDIDNDNSMNLNYDIPSDWDEIYSNGKYNSAIRRRLGWYNHIRHKGRYVADSITRRFKDAQNNCRHLYGDLASIMSKEEEEQVKDLCAMINLGNCWIGYKKPWGHWEDGRRPTYLHWKPGEPNNYGGNEGCAEIHTSGQWNDIKCTLSRIGVCERARIHVVGHYIAVMRSLNWADANKRCQELFSTDLATIENARENIMVRRACSALNADADCWVGLRRPFRTWQDGEDAKVHNWADGEPNNAGGHEDCTAIEDTQRWKDEKCDIGKYFVCNTITHDTRIKKRAEQKRRQQEKEAELEKKRKKMEDEIINQYMQQNQGNMMNQMMSGGSLYGGASGIGSPGGQMMAFANGGQPSMHQMFQMGSKEGQAAGLFNQMMTRQTGSMGGIGHQQSMYGQHHQRPNYEYNHGGLDSGMSVGNLQPHQLESIYGNLGPLGSGNGMGQYTPGKPLQIQLVGRRRLQLLDVINEHQYGHNIDDIYGKKCKTLNSGHDICIGHNYINVRKYIDRLNKKIDKKIMKQFQPISIDMDMNNTQINIEPEEDDFNINPDTNYMEYKNWKTSNYRNNKIMNNTQNRFDNFVNYFLNQDFIFDHLNGDNNQCFGYHDNFNLCMNMMDNNNMRMMINNDERNAFHFDNDNHWDEIELINGKSSPSFDNNKITSKCNYIYSGDMETKVCMQQTHNGDHGLSLYKSSVQFLATSGHRDNFPQFQF